MNNIGLLFWIAVIIICVLLEIPTISLSTIWFAIGGAGGLACCLLGFDDTIQVLVFIAVSVILLLFTAPFLKRAMKVGEQKTNVDALIGKTGVALDWFNDFEPGSVKIDGKVWSSIAVPGEYIKEKEKVQIEAIEGVKLVVRKLPV
ncbi:MAG: NfeD family protein [Eubacteriaceae bacterium]|nr:NfeD family protein [Eubacteriaceae bacterium]